MFALALLGPAACAPGGGCALTKLATVPLEIVDGLPVIKVGINGEPARLVFDTGANLVLLERDLARRAGVGIESRISFGTAGVGGSSEILPGLVQRLTLGEAEVNDIWSAVKPSAFPPFDGLLGTTAMEPFEFELDGPGRTMTVYRARYCEVKAPGWTGPFNALRITRAGHGLRAAVTVGGVPMTALLDTGATAGAVTPDAAARAGVDAAELARAPVRRGRSVVQGGFEFKVATLPNVQVGTLMVRAPEFIVTALPKEAGDILLGSNLLLYGRLWIAVRAGRVFLGMPAGKG